MAARHGSMPDDQCQDQVATVAACIGVDLVNASRDLVKLLIAVDCFPNGGLYDGPYATEAVRRYEAWLTLLASPLPSNIYRGDLVPPLDVAYAWLCHRLNPRAYKQDCMQLFGKEIHPTSPAQALAFGDGSPGSKSALTAALVEGRSSPHCLSGNTWWKDRDTRDKYFPPQLLSIDLAHAKGTATKAELDAAVKELENSALANGWSIKQSRLSYDVAKAMSRQGKFLRNVLRAAFCEKPFLLRAVDRYARFLVLWRERGNEVPLVPMYDIDLMWHAHMAHSGQYLRDMENIKGPEKFLNHDDNLDDDELSTGFIVIKAAFEARFDMLYNPPLTQRVPDKERHPAEKVVGQSLLNALRPPSAALLKLAAMRADLQEAIDKKAGQGAYSARNPAASEMSQQRRETTLYQHAAEAAPPPARQERNGGAALYIMYLMELGLARRKSSVVHRLLHLVSCGSHISSSAAKQTIESVTKLTLFDPEYAPFRHDHPFFTSLTLLPYDSPLTIWRTPPGSAPGTLRKALHVAEHVRKLGEPFLSVPPAPPAKGMPVSAPPTLPRPRPHPTLIHAGPTNYRRSPAGNPRSVYPYYPSWSYAYYPYLVPYGVYDYELDSHDICSSDSTWASTLASACTVDYSPADLYPCADMHTTCWDAGFAPYDMSAMGSQFACGPEAAAAAEAAQQQALADGGTFVGDTGALLNGDWASGGCMMNDVSTVMDTVQELSIYDTSMISVGAAACGGTCAGAAGAAGGCSCAGGGGADSNEGESACVGVGESAWGVGVGGGSTWVGGGGSTYGGGVGVRSTWVAGGGSTYGGGVRGGSAYIGGGWWKAHAGVEV